MGSHDLLLRFEGPPEAFRALCGELGAHLQLIGRALGVRISQRGDAVRVYGDDGSVELAVSVLAQLYELERRGFPLHPLDVEQACRLVQRDPEVALVELFGSTVFVPGRNRTVFPRTANQQRYVEARIASTSRCWFAVRGKTLRLRPGTKTV